MSFVQVNDDEADNLVQLRIVCMDVQELTRVKQKIVFKEVAKLLELNRQARSLPDGEDIGLVPKGGGSLHEDEANIVATIETTLL